MSRLSREDPRIWGILTQGKISCAGNEIRWSPLKAEGSEYFIAPLNRDDKKAEIEKCLREESDAEYIFIASSDADMKNCTAVNNSEEEYIGKLYETFGKEPVDIVERL